MFMTGQNQPKQVDLQSEGAQKQETIPQTKKKFVEPEMSLPVDVLEATTFFQAVDSGPTN
jgi:hypothetical protein